MKERPILFNSKMVAAIIAGEKTQTRRVFPQGYLHNIDHSVWGPTKARAAKEPGLWMWDANNRQTVFSARCRYGLVGDRLWVRETWGEASDEGYKFIRYRADGACLRNGYESGYLSQTWRPSIFMPRWASRILLEITAIRVERLQEITQQDARSEGVKRLTIADGGYVPTSGSDYVGAFRLAWDSINAKRGYAWERNPWVFVIEFKRIMP